MRIRLSQTLGWISFFLAFAVMGATEQDLLSAAQLAGGSLLACCGLLCALLGQCTAIQRARRAARHAPAVRRRR